MGQYPEDIGELETESHLAHRCPLCMEYEYDGVRCTCNDAYSEQIEEENRNG